MPWKEVTFRKKRKATKRKNRSNNDNNNNTNNNNDTHNDKDSSNNNDNNEDDAKRTRIEKNHINNCDFIFFKMYLNLLDNTVICLISIHS